MTERFELLQQLGRGGMGTVWKARDVETGEVVALKLLHSMYVDDPEYVERFEREVEIARRIDSPHVVKVLGFGRRDGVPYVAMEFVDGPSLRERLKASGPVGWDEAKRIATQLAQALAAAHGAGIVHRDIKPSNVLLDPDGQVKLADFGIARANDLTRMTGSVTVLGTPGYMAPDRQASPQSDLYGLGCVLFELMSGAPPFEGDSHSQVLLMHLQDPPDLGRLPAGARRIVGWLLAKDAQRRPATASALLAVLNGSTPQPPPPRAARRRRPARRLAFIVSSVGVLGLAGISVVFSLASNAAGEDKESPDRFAGATASPIGSSPTARVDRPTPPDTPLRATSTVGVLTQTPEFTAVPITPESRPGGGATVDPTPRPATPIPTPTTIAPTPTATFTVAPPTAIFTPRPQPPEKPGTLSYCGGSPTSFCVRWSDQSHNEDGFRVYMNGNFVGEVGAGSTSFVVDGLTPGATYCFAVAAYNAAGESNRTTGICKNP